MTRRPTTNRALDVLVAWYGIFQTGHCLLNAGYLVGDGPPPFPGPPGGWSTQALGFLDAVALADLLNAVVSVAVCVAYFRGRRWSVVGGLATLVVSLYASAVFTYAALATGAWRTSTSTTYLATWLPFLPVVLLAVVFARAAHDGRLEDGLARRGI